MNESSTIINLSNIRPSDYLIVNVNQAGYYRVMYDKANWILIAKYLNSEQFIDFSPNTRAMLINDAGTFFYKKSLDLEIFLTIIGYLKEETDYIPWLSATNNLLYMRRMLDDGESTLYFKFQVCISTI